MKKLYFIHIPRSGGTYALKQLTNEFGDYLVREGHTVPVGTLRPWMTRFGPEHYTSVKKKDCLTFTIVRNSFDLLVSMYIWGFPGWAPLNAASGLGINWPFASFRDYIEALARYDDSPWPMPLQRESLFFQIYDRQGKIYPDYILRKEAMTDGLQSLGIKLGVKLEPEPTQINQKTKFSYQEYYDQDIYDLVVDRFVEDLGRFGYDFNGFEGLHFLRREDLESFSIYKNYTRSLTEAKIPSGSRCDINEHPFGDEILSTVPARKLFSNLSKRLLNRLLPNPE